QPSLQALPQQDRLVPGATGLRPEEDQDRAGRAPLGSRLQRLPLLRFQRENRDPGEGQGFLLLAKTHRVAGSKARRRYRRRALHPLRRQHAGAVREAGAADDGSLPGRHPQGNRQDRVRGRLRAERQTEPENH
nr:hypothetical protein [Tanacetum cinerariifolium]